MTLIFQTNLEISHFEKNLAEQVSGRAELINQGQGIHLHYIYTGDPTQLSRVYDDHVEVKVFTGKSSTAYAVKV